MTPIGDHVAPPRRKPPAKTYLCMTFRPGASREQIDRVLDSAAPARFDIWCANHIATLEDGHAFYVRFAASMTNGAIARAGEWSRADPLVWSVAALESEPHPQRPPVPFTGHLPPGARPTVTIGELVIAIRMIFDEATADRVSREVFDAKRVHALGQLIYPSVDPAMLSDVPRPRTRPRERPDADSAPASTPDDWRWVTELDEDERTSLFRNFTMASCLATLVSPEVAARVARAKDWAPRMLAGVIDNMRALVRTVQHPSRR